MAHFSIKEALWFGWDKTRAHSALVFPVVLTLFALQVFGTMAQKVLEGTALGLMVVIVTMVLGIFLSTGATIISLKLARGGHAHYRDIVPHWELVWRFFAASVLSGLATVVGLIALVIPGIYIALRLSMVRLAVLDGASIRESFSVSSKLTHDIKLKLLGFFLVLTLLNIVGALAFMVGLLLTLPVSAIAWAHVYLKLKARTG